MQRSSLYTLLLASAAAALLAAPFASAQPSADPGVKPSTPAPKPFPDEWFFSGPQRPAPLRALEGQKATDLSINEWIGDPISVTDQKGKVVVVDFWATWCGPCMASLPHNVELVDQYKDRGLVFIGVHDSQRGWETAPSVIKQKHINYPVGHDTGASAAAYHLEFLPTYVVIDRAGVIRAAGLTPNHVEDVIKQLLDEKAPAGAAGASGFPDDDFLTGDIRPPAMKALEGKPAPALNAASWVGTAVKPEDMKGRVVVLHLGPPSPTTMAAQMTVLAAREKKLPSSTDLLVIGVADPRAEAEKLKVALDAKHVALPVAIDTPTKSSFPSGATARAFAAKTLPVTIIIDKAGVVRATAVKPDKVADVVKVLLAEKAPEVADASSGSGQTAAKP